MGAITVSHTTSSVKANSTDSQKISSDAWNGTGAHTVVITPGAAVADATGAGDVVAQLNTLLARIRALGLIST